MAFVWLCATPCGATGLVIDAVPMAVPVAVPVAPVEAPVEVSLPALRRGAVALVLAVAVVAGVSAGDARAIGGSVVPDLISPDLTSAASSSTPGTPDDERPVPRRRGLV